MNIMIKDIVQLKRHQLAGSFFLGYLKLAAVTGRIEFRNMDKIRTNTMVGYWHGDSYCMQLVLKEFAKEKKKIQIIITADKMGDYIQQMVRRYGAEAIRLPDGLKMRPFFAQLKADSTSEGSILATALDGPTGPLHEPKKLLFFLASEADKEMTYVHFTYNRVLRLKNRWDNYVIPLPFAKIVAEVEDLGKITKMDLKNFNDYKKRLLF